MVLQFEHYARLRLVDLTMQIHAQCQQLRYYYGSRPLSPLHVSTMVLLEVGD